MAQFISDHSPLDDYQRILSQVDYYIENVEYNNRLPYDNREKLNKFPAYKAVFKTMKIMLAISGLSLPVAIVIIWTYANIINSNMLRFVSVGSVFMVIGTFVPALLIGGVGAYMESHSEKKTRKRNIYRKVKHGYC